MTVACNNPMSAMQARMLSFGFTWIAGGLPSDLLSSDFDIYVDVWGFDENAVKVLENMRPADENLIYKYAILLGEKAFKPIKREIEVQQQQQHTLFCTLFVL